MAHPPRPQPPPQPPPQQPQRPAGDINVQAWLDGAVEPSQLIHQSLDSVGGPLRVDSAGLRHQGGDTDTFWQQSFPLGTSITPGGKAAFGAGGPSRPPQAKPNVGIQDAFSPLYNSQNPPPPRLADSPDKRTGNPRSRRGSDGSCSSSSSGTESTRAKNSPAHKKGRKWRDASGCSLTIDVPQVQHGPHSPETKPVPAESGASSAAMGENAVAHQLEANATGQQGGSHAVDSSRRGSASSEGSGSSSVTSRSSSQSRSRQRILAAGAGQPALALRRMALKLVPAQILFEVEEIPDSNDPGISTDGRSIAKRRVLGYEIASLTEGTGGLVVGGGRPDPATICRALFNKLPPIANAEPDELWARVHRLVVKLFQRSGNLTGGRLDKESAATDADSTAAAKSLDVGASKEPDHTSGDPAPEPQPLVTHRQFSTYAKEGGQNVEIKGKLQAPLQDHMQSRMPPMLQPPAVSSSLQSPNDLEPAMTPMTDAAAAGLWADLLNTSPQVVPIEAALLVASPAKDQPEQKQTASVRKESPSTCTMHQDGAAQVTSLEIDQAAHLVESIIVELDSLVELAITTPPRTYSVADGQPNISSPRRQLSTEFYSAAFRWLLLEARWAELFACSNRTPEEQLEYKAISAAKHAARQELDVTAAETLLEHQYEEARHYARHRLADCRRMMRLTPEELSRELPLLLDATGAEPFA